MLFLRFLLGILAIQAATAALVILASRQETLDARLATVLPLVVVALVAALWFHSLVSQARRLTRARLEERFSREREKLQVRAEREKTKVLEKNRQRLERERSRIQARAGRKVTLAMGGLLLAGGVMMFTQFMTLGLLLVTGTGGALAGYLLRTKQALASRRTPRVEEKNRPPLLEER